MESLFPRELYMSKIRPFVHETDLIKVLTGIRRCGKSTIMRLVADELACSGIDDSHIIFLNLDKRGYRSIRTAEQLDELIEQTSPASGTTYLFIDEVQNVHGFEEVINSWREEGTHSIFVTGSNSYLLSGELATKLTGRYIEFEIFTLSFAEYLGMKRHLGKPISSTISEEFDYYLLEGGFPRAVYFDDLHAKQMYVNEVVREIFTKDIARRIRIQNRSVFSRVRDYAIANFGATLSLKNIAQYFRNTEGIPIKEETIHRYLTALEEAKILYRCPRFDIKSKRSLRREQKYYIADLSLYSALSTDARINYGPALENIVYVYARSAGYSVSVGKIGKLECDFIVRDSQRNYAFIQVSRSIMDPSTEEREYASLERIRDGSPKYLLTRDTLLQQRSGVLHANIESFLADERQFGFR